MKTVILVVLDGFGIGPPSTGNAVHLANPQNINSYLYTYPNTTLRASGEAVGLPGNEVGNTEVGHINLGAGRIVYQDLPRINMNIADGGFFSNSAFNKAINHTNTTKGKLHIIGLMSQGSVHSSMDHLYALMHLAKDKGLKEVYIHAITDGRDSPPKSALELIKQFEEKSKQIVGCNFIIASIMGRYYGMDRDKRWERTEKAYVCLTRGEGQKATSAIEVIENSYKQGVNDEFIEPTNIGYQPVLIKENDAVIFFNYRIDRPRQLTKAFVLDDFENTANQSTSYDPFEVKYHKTHLFPKQQPTSSINPPFKRGEKIKNLFFVTMTEYEKKLVVEVAFPEIVVTMPLGKILSDHNMTQLHMSESEKERFVTFYFNGQRDEPFSSEERLIIPSPKVTTYDLKPEMSAYELTDEIIKQLEQEKFNFILINYANADMVGHTGNLDASIKAVQVLDECLGKLVTSALNFNTTIFITADHGNVEQKINPKTGQVSTEHTDNPVPFIAISKEFQRKLMKLQSGILADVAPTILKTLDIPVPSEMMGRDLLEEIR